ncbi:predicted protein [Postia placenta Mad-698-R]|nr:predicted protein [Postia placenta Mad-698-R]
MSSLFQNSFYIGNIINGVLYGVELVLYLTTMYWLLEKKRKHTRRDSDKFFMFFSTVLFTMSTINLIVESIFGEEMWIVNADYPGGMNAWFAANASVWYETMGSAAGVVLNLFADGLMIYRCFVIYNSFAIVIFPCFLYISTFALGIATLYMSGKPSGDFFAGQAADVALAYNCGTIGINVIVTCLICGRIFYFARRARRELDYAAAEPYMNALAIVIESALPFSVFGIMFLVTYGMNNGLEMTFMSFYVLFTAISPQLIVMRVIAGRAWTRQTGAAMTTMEFVSSPGETMETSGQSNSVDNDAIDVSLRAMEKGGDLSSVDIVNRVSFDSLRPAFPSQNRLGIPCPLTLPFQPILSHRLVHGLPIHTLVVSNESLRRNVASEDIRWLESDVGSAEHRVTQDVEAVRRMAGLVLRNGFLPLQDAKHPLHAVQLVGEGEREETIVWAEADLLVPNGTSP